MADWDNWIGRETTASDVLTDTVIARFKATLGTDHTLGLHWCLCLPGVPMAQLGPDGHPVRGIDLPPIALPRRMWAASDVQFHAALPSGAAIARRSIITAITAKTGTTGPLVFVEITHETRANGSLAVSERQTLVFRGAATAAATAPPPAAAADPGAEPADWQRTLTPDAPLLFRYSALTFNSHRIHYDLPYATATEGYRGLVVHGPLIATLLLDLAAQHVGANRIASLRFRGQSPAIAGEPLTLSGRTAGDTLILAAHTPAGAVMHAELHCIS